MNVRKKVTYIKKFNIRKALLGILSLTLIPIATVVIVVVLNIKTFIDDGLLYVMGIDKESGLYYLFDKYFDFGKYQEIFLWVIFVFCCILICLKILVYWKNNRHERILVLEHNSLNQISFKYDESIRENYIFKTRKFNQYSTFNMKIQLDEMIKQVIAEVDNETIKLKRYIEKDYLIGYAGIANIPATFMLGYEIGDENSKKFFHKYHGMRTDDKLKDNKFHLLGQKTIHSSFEYNILQEPKDDFLNANIVILISLTQPIEKDDYISLIGDNDYIYKYSSSDHIDYDIVDSDTQIEKYSKKILSDISEIQKQPKIKQIRLCIAASGVFVFGLGTQFSKTQNKETIIFHYEKSNYPWGINVTKKVPVINS